MSLYSATTGTSLKAADLNQYANLLNGSVGGQLLVSGGSTTTNVPLTLLATSGATSGSQVTGRVTGDTGAARVWVYLSGGNLALGFSDGVSSGSLGDLQASTTSSGWYIPQDFTAGGNLTVVGSGSSLASLAVSGNMTVTGTTTASGGISVNATNVAYSGSATVPVWPAGSGGTGVWWSDDGANYVQGTTVKGSNGNGRDFGLSRIDAANAIHTGLSAQYGGAVHVWDTLNLLGSTTLGGVTNGSFSITTAATVSHGLSATPDAIIWNLGSTGNQQAWSTIGTNSVGSSTFGAAAANGSAMNAYFIAFGA